MTNYYDICYPCKHVFKPKRLNKKQLEDRLHCICVCHWGIENNGLGITDKEAQEVYKK